MVVGAFLEGQVKSIGVGGRGDFGSSNSAVLLEVNVLTCSPSREIMIWEFSSIA